MRTRADRRGRARARSGLRRAPLHAVRGRALGGGERGELGGAREQSPALRGGGVARGDVGDDRVEARGRRPHARGGLADGARARRDRARGAGGATRRDAERRARRRGEERGRERHREERGGLRTRAGGSGRRDEIAPTDRRTTSPTGAFHDVDARTRAGSAPARGSSALAADEEGVCHVFPPPPKIVWQTVYKKRRCLIREVRDRLACPASLGIFFASHLFSSWPKTKPRVVALRRPSTSSCLFVGSSTGLRTPSSC